MSFKLWSETDPESAKVLKPDMGIRSWDNLDNSHKNTILKHLMNAGWFKDDSDTHDAVRSFAQKYKARGFCQHLLSHGGPHYIEIHGTRSMRKDCCNYPSQQDAEHIFLNEHHSAVYELISHYAKQLNDNNLGRFITTLNDISEQFGLDILAQSDGLIPRQDQKIIEEVYEPTLKVLSDHRWVSASRDLSDAFSDYQKGSPEGYSSCITHAVSALQGFLQILVNGKPGKGDIDKLLQQAIAKKLIPDDLFTAKALKEIVSVLMSERQSKGDPHPKAEYANEKSAKLTLNLVMVFIQHCLLE